MMTTHPVPKHLLPHWQDEKHLRSGDCVWILTDIQSFESSYLPWSKPQDLFEVGIYDLETQKVGLARFGKDLAYALIKLGLPPPPWDRVAPFAVALRRQAHDGEPKGRYLVSAEEIPVQPQWWGVLPTAFKLLYRTPHCPNSKPGMWDDLVARATRENAIEQYALRRLVPFSAGDIKIAIGDPKADVTSVLQRLVADGKLASWGKKRGTKYRVP